ncbi:MAG: N-acetyltransferase family protein [Clostridium sp.]|uniref:GNAT family N-acetyltransferase n=1 Tax=Clostridium sp. TaxID=1506 RepID=UPI002A8FE4A2|nr:N-acetyltransferase family protein [Clostridium sp.]MDY5096954.1 N-acetyltransferase family protein [Clostridium sp.]
MNYKLIEMTKSHWTEVKEIYIQGIETHNATFQTEAPSWDEWDKGHIKCCRFVAIDENEKVLGWVSLSPTSKRPCYAGVVEVSLYIHNDYKGIGVGTALMNKVIEESEKSGFWTIESLIIAENTASIALHKKCGFQMVGIRRNPAKMDTVGWMDVAVMERRSSIVGVD